MPITQERMLALISAARHYEAAFDSICEAHRAALQRVTPHLNLYSQEQSQFAREQLNAAKAAAWDQLERIIDGASDSIPSIARANIATEAQHYRHVSRANERKRNYYARDKERGFTTKRVRATDPNFDPSVNTRRAPRTMLLSPAPNLPQLMKSILPASDSVMEQIKENKYKQMYPEAFSSGLEEELTRKAKEEDANKIDMLRRGLDPMNGQPFADAHAHHLALIEAGLFAELAKLQSEEDDGYALGGGEKDDLL